MEKQYLLKNIDTGVKTLCTKIKSPSGSIYFVTDDETNTRQFYDLTHNTVLSNVFKDSSDGNIKFIVASTNIQNNLTGEILGYGDNDISSKEYSKKDMFDFMRYVKHYKFLDGTKPESEYSDDELLSMWKKQIPEIINFRQIK